MDGMTLAQLAADVHATAVGDDPLDRLDAAIAVAASLAHHGDTVVNQFVGEARAAGLSWTEIGTRLGVSKQAARKRFADPGPTPALPAEVILRPRLQTCLAQAGVYAQEAGAAEIRAEHLLAGLLTDGVAATILTGLGVTADAVTASTIRLFGPTSAPVDAVPPLAADAVCAIEAAAHRAQVNVSDSGDVSVGTEQLLAVLALDHGSRAYRILVDLGVDVAAVKKELACYLTLNPPRTRRFGRARRATTATCSFCGAAESPTRPLAHGAGAMICTVCAQRAVQSLARRSRM